MKWRSIDNMIASCCIQKLQQEINQGKKRASDYIPIPCIDEKDAKEMYNAWRVYFIDRMMHEYDEQGWANDQFSVEDELEYDLNYYNKLVEEENRRKESGK